MPSTRPSSNSTALAKLDRWERAVTLWGGGGGLCALTALTVADVTGRYFFNAPIHGARDVAKMLLLAMVALSVAYSTRTGGQVAIELVVERLGERLRFALAVSTRLVGAAALVLVSGRLALGGLNAGRFAEASLELGIPYAPFYTLLAAGMALYALVLVVETTLLLADHRAGIDEGGH